jgi:hypothetical protein
MSTQDTVNSYLISQGIAFAVQYIGERTRDEWKHDKWVITFTSGKGSADFEYCTGLGHREQPTAAAKARIKWNFPGLTERDIKARTSWGLRYLAAVEASRKPQAPDAASVLHSLILDSEAEFMTFEEWCETFGYSSDSIKAECTFDACRKNAREIRAVFSREQIQHLQELDAEL